MRHGRTGSDRALAQYTRSCCWHAGIRFAKLTAVHAQGDWRAVVEMAGRWAAAHVQAPAAGPTAAPDVISLAEPGAEKVLDGAQHPHT